MADNKLLLKRGADEDFLAEDDPLAELARIVGFDSAPVAKPAASHRREPAFDLEDELLKELEIYALPVTAEAAESVPAFEPVAVHEPEVAPEPEITPEVEDLQEDLAPVRPPVVLEAVETFEDAAEGRVYERPASHPVFDLEDEILREFAAFDARRVTPHDERPVSAEVIRQQTLEPAEVPAELHDVPDVRSMAATSVSRDDGRKVYDSFFDDDLDAAIGDSAAPRVDDPESPADEQLAAVDPTPSSHHDMVEEHIAPALEPIDDGYWADLGGANGLAPEVTGGVPGGIPASETAVQAPDPVPDLAAFPAPLADAAVQVSADEPMAHDDTGFPQAEEISQFADPPEAQAVDSPVAMRPAPADDYGLDALLAEVESYPVGDGSSRWGVQSKPVAVEEIEKAAPPVVQDFVPGYVDAQADPRLPGDTLPVAAPSLLADSDLSFDDGQIEIDLGEIDLDLSDLHEADFDVSPEVLSEIASAPVAPQEVAIRSESALESPAAQRLVPPIADADYSSLPFDPSQITQEDDPVEVIADMDVPDAPVAHEEDRPAPHPEYDIDLDAEMAQLFATATTPALSNQRSGQVQDNVVAFGAVAAKAPASALDLDEFERALEEDFRRSFTENKASANPDRVALAPAIAGPLPERGRRNWVLLGSAAMAIVLFGGAGVYAYLSGDTKILASSEPKVILADTDPVKVVPDDPGGKQVPNQNKAVYDRVAGEQPGDTKQESLLTSNEEPVDVVQRTLEPENLPMDDDAMAVATPTGDTVDPRLLPDEAEQDRVTTTSKVVSGVSPRKVKTMVVRSDGTLVEREVTEEDLKQQAANDAELMKIAEKAARDAAIATDSQADDIAKAIESVPERLAPSDDAAAKPVTTAEDKPVLVSEPEAVTETPDTVVDPIDAAKVQTEQTPVTEKPADEVAKSVEKAELKPVDTTVADKPVERSIAVETETSAIDDSAVAKAADAQVEVTPVEVAPVEVAPADEVQVEDAPVRKVKTTKITPVPENRPVDQPVTVVGTVTDQGTVRSDTEVKQQEVALADPAAKTPAETTALPAGAYVIQIASLPSEAEAQTSYARLSAKFAGVIGGRGVDIRKAQIKNKGTYYRVRIPAGSKQEAQALCAQYKKAGGSCLVSK